MSAPEDQTVWNCPYCIPRLCRCDWCKDDAEPEKPESNAPEPCQSTGDLFGGECPTIQHTGQSNAK